MKTSLPSNTEGWSKWRQIGLHSCSLNAQSIRIAQTTFCLSDAALNEGCPLTDRVLINLLTYCPHRRMLRVVELYRSNYSQSVENSLHHWLNEFYAVLPSFGEVKLSEGSIVLKPSGAINIWKSLCWLRRVEWILYMMYGLRLPPGWAIKVVQSRYKFYTIKLCSSEAT
jgi:hypothetical protein